MCARRRPGEPLVVRRGRPIRGSILLVFVVGGFLASSISFMKLIGFSLGLSVLLDAFITRGLLLPAAMSVLNDRAWWPRRQSGSGRGADRVVRARSSAASPASR